MEQLVAELGSTVVTWGDFELRSVLFNIIECRFPSTWLGPESVTQFFHTLKCQA